MARGSSSASALQFGCRSLSDLEKGGRPRPSAGAGCPRSEIDPCTLALFAGGAGARFWSAPKAKARSDRLCHPSHGRGL